MQQELQKLEHKQVIQKRMQRDAIFKLLFRNCFIKDSFEETLDLICEDFYERNEKLHYFDETDKEFIFNKVISVQEKCAELDELINKFAKGWNTDRISFVDLSILRLAIFDIKYSKNIPVNVSINEAVLLAKTFGADKSKAFINGTLSSINKYIYPKN